VAKAGGTSDVWDSYDVVNTITSAAVGYVRCHKCESLFKHNSSIGVSSLKRHADSNCQKRAPGDRRKSNNELKKRVTKLCVEMCARDCRPFNTVAGEVFKKLAQGLVDIGAKIGNVDATDLLPTPPTISRNVRTVTEELRQKVVSEVSTAMSESRCHCTSDMWSDKHSQSSYTAVTAHYIDQDWIMKNVLLALNEYPIEEDHSGVKIIEEVCKRKCCTSRQKYSKEAICLLKRGDLNATLVKSETDKRMATTNPFFNTWCFRWPILLCFRQPAILGVMWVAYPHYICTVYFGRLLGAET